MKVVLIRPPYVIPKNSVYGNRGVPPIGLVYIGTHLLQNNFDVQIIDCFAEDMDNFCQIDETDFFFNGLNTSSLIAKIPKDVSVIGISCMFSNEWIHTNKIIQQLKINFPNSIIVLGGEHATADYEYILNKYSEVDFCILGEGEYKFLSLLHHLKNKLPIESGPSFIAYKNSDQQVIVTKNDSYRIKNINELAHPNWSLIPIRTYLDRGYGFSMLGKRSIPMIFSRGCPYRCTFCSNESMWTTQWKARESNDIILELKNLKSLYKIEHVDVFDLTAIVNRSWTIDFCKKLISENLNLTWALPSGTRSEALDAEVLDLLFKSGCRKITYAPETGSVRMSQMVQKKVDLKKMLNSMRTAVKKGFIVKANIIFGFPEEKWSDVFYNFLFIAKMAAIGIHDVPCFGFTPYPGSALFKKLLSEKVVQQDENYDLYLARLVYTSPLDRRSWNPHFPNFVMPLLSLGGMSFFYSLQYLIRPWRLIYLIVRLFKNSPVTMLEAALINIYETRLRKV